MSSTSSPTSDDGTRAEPALAGIARPPCFLGLMLALPLAALLWWLLLHLI